MLADDLPKVGDQSAGYTFDTANGQRESKTLKMRHKTVHAPTDEDCLLLLSLGFHEPICL